MIRYNSGSFGFALLFRLHGTFMCLTEDLVVVGILLMCTMRRLFHYRFGRVSKYFPGPCIDCNLRNLAKYNRSRGGQSPNLRPSLSGTWG